MQNWPQGDVATADASLHYYRSGGDLPPLVLVHGFTDHALYFTRVAETLTQRWDVIAYDQRGHGQSSRAQGRFDTALLADDLAAVAEALALDRPAVVGHSLGGAVITLALTTSLATRCRGAVLEDPFWLELPDAVAARYRDARAQHVDGWRAWVTELQRMPRAEALALRHADEPTWSAIDVETCLDGRLMFQLDLFDQFPSDAAPWRDPVRQFDVPVQLLTGSDTSRGTVVSSADALEATTLNSQLQWREIDGAGHHIKYDRFNEYVASVTSFLNALV